jgi:outer membrane murein-binding lipoprotein Lpp
MRRRTLFALAVLAASGLAACGSSDEKLLSASSASELRSALRQVERDVADGNCSAAQQEVTRLRQEVDSLSSVEADLKESLSEGTTRLESLVLEQCQSAATGPTGPVEPVVPQEEQTQGERDDGKKEKQKKDENKGDEGGQGQGENGGTQGDESGGSGTGGTTGSGGVLP